MLVMTIISDPDPITLERMLLERAGLNKLMRVSYKLGPSRQIFSKKLHNRILHKDIP